MTTDDRSREELRAENEELRYRLEEAEELLSAIQSGAVDALVVSKPEGEQIFTLEGAEHPYRVLVETMSEGAATLDSKGSILYCNSRLATMLQLPLEKLIGVSLGVFVLPGDNQLYAEYLGKGTNAQNGKVEITLLNTAGDHLPVLMSCSAIVNGQISGVVLTDLTELKQAEAVLKDMNATLERRVAERTAELQDANTLLRDSRLAALNMMEDALVARRQAEETSCELRATNDELERFNNVSVGRELRMIELKKEINALCARIEEPPRYPLEFEEG